MPTYRITAPNGRTYAVQGPEGASEDQVRAEVLRQHPEAGEKPASHAQGFVEGITAPALNTLRVLNKVNPVMAVADMVTGAPRKAVQGASNVAQAQRERSRYQGSTIGKIAGNIVGTLPAAFLPGGAVVQGAAAGAMSNEDGTALGLVRDATIGAVAGKAGSLIGKGAERLGRTAPARAVGAKIANTIRRPQLPNAPRITGPERTIVRATKSGPALRKKPDLEPIRKMAQDAADLNLPLSLADTSPELRNLAGSAARYSPKAQALAMKNFDLRHLGQADRAVNAVDNILAPVTDIERRSGVLRKLGSRAAGPHYREAFAKGAPIDETTAAMLQTPAGKDALRRATTIAQNEGRDPRSLGFELDDQGEVLLRKEPSFETLDLVKRGLDDKLNDFRNPVTGQLVLEGNPLAQSVEGLRRRFVAHLDTLNDDYTKARGAYQPFARRAEALGTGQRLASSTVPQRQFDATLSRADDLTMPEIQRGYATSMADTVNRQRLSANPYTAVYGSADQQAKVSRLFPEGAPRFNRQYEIENEMALTRQKVLGGSDTQARNLADERFRNEAAAATLDALTSGGAPSAMKAAGVLGRNVMGPRNIGLLQAERKAETLAPQLFDTSNPKALADYITDLAQRLRDEELRKQAYQRTFGRLGAPAAALLAGSTNP